MTLNERVAAYAASSEGLRFPDSIPVVGPSGTRMVGHWIMGQDFSDPNPPQSDGEQLYGAYPPRYLRRVLALFPEISKSEMVHFCSGSVPDDAWFRIDICPDRVPTPDLVADVQDLPKHLLGCQYQLGMVDIPYGEKHAAEYQTPMPNRKKSLESIACVMPRGSHLVWLDTKFPMFRKIEWSWWGSITVIRSTNHDVRECFFFERQ